MLLWHNTIQSLKMRINLMIFFSTALQGLLYMSVEAVTEGGWNRNTYLIFNKRHHDGRTGIFHTDTHKRTDVISHFYNSFRDEKSQVILLFFE